MSSHTQSQSSSESGSNSKIRSNRTNGAGTKANALEVSQARKAKYVAFSHRDPFTRDAYELGYLTGVREDYTYQKNGRNLRYPVMFLDNQFKNPDLDRYVSKFQRYEPDVAVIGDADTREDAHEILDVISGLSEQYTFIPIIVPKCDCFDIIPDWVTLGYPSGYSKLDPEDFSSLSDWRGRNIHVLGGNPHDQWDAIKHLTTDTVSEPPANIVGLDGNGFQQYAYWGKYWTPDGSKMAEETLTARETVKKSLKHVKQFWKQRNVWPESTPKTHYGESMVEPDEMVWAGSGHDIHGDADEHNLDGHEDIVEAHDNGDEPITDAVVVDYTDEENDVGVVAYRSEIQRERTEYYMGWGEYNQS